MYIKFTSMIFSILTSVFVFTISDAAHAADIVTVERLYWDFIEQKYRPNVPEAYREGVADILSAVKSGDSSKVIEAINHYHDIRQPEDPGDFFRPALALAYLKSENFEQARYHWRVSILENMIDEGSLSCEFFLKKYTAFGNLPSELREKEEIAALYKNSDYLLSDYSYPYKDELLDAFEGHCDEIVGPIDPMLDGARHSRSLLDVVWMKLEAQSYSN